MGNRRVERSLVKKEKAGTAAPPAGDDQEEVRRVLLEKLYLTRLALQRTPALSAHADQIINRLTAVTRRMKLERDQAYALLVELQARRNAQATMTAHASGSPAAAFAATSSSYGNCAVAMGSEPGMAGKKMSSGTGSELGLVAEQMLRRPRKKGKVVEAPVHVEEDADRGTSAEETVSDARSTEAGDSVDKKEKCHR